MILKSLVIKNLRSINALNMSFEPGINLIYGRNGIGKTSILESIYMLSISRSFKSHFLKNIITDGKSGVKITGKIKDDLNTNLKIEYVKSKTTKTIKINDKKIKNMSELLGIFPVTILSPDDIGILDNNKEKRSFFNIVLCHTNKRYLHTLQQYQTAVKQRNSLLQQKASIEYIDLWDEKLSSLAEILWNTKKKFFKEYNQIFNVLWKQLECSYNGTINYNLNQALSKSEYKAKLKSNIENDIKRGYTNQGPHRDNIDFYFNSLKIKECGSQGEKKLFLIVVKIAEAIYLGKHLKREPVVLLDDLFATLDKKRGLKILNLLTNNFQIFVTTTDINAESYFSNKNQLNFIKLEEHQDICFAA